MTVNTELASAAEQVKVTPDVLGAVTAQALAAPSVESKAMPDSVMAIPALAAAVIVPAGVNEIVAVVCVALTGEASVTARPVMAPPSTAVARMANMANVKEIEFISMELWLLQSSAAISQTKFTTPSCSIGLNIGVLRKVKNVGLYTFYEKRLNMLDCARAHASSAVLIELFQIVPVVKHCAFYCWRMSAALGHSLH